MTFDNFINDFSTNKCAEFSRTARKVYEDVIYNEQNRIKMAECSDLGITALSAVAEEITAVCSEENSDFKLDTKLHRQTVGRMVAAAILDLGYSPANRARVITKTKTPFSTAHVYTFNEDTAREVIVKKIVSK